jgi:polysaccharide biosynthesis protein PslH
MTHTTLFITTGLPRNGGSGGQIASWRALQAHAAIGPVDLIAAVPAGSEPSSELTALVDRCRLVDIDAFYFARARRALMETFVRAQVRGVPYRVVKFSDERVRHCVVGWSRERRYSVVHCDFVTNWQYAAAVEAPLRLLLHHNIESQTYSTLGSTRRAPAKWMLAREARHARRHELEAIERADHTLVLSDTDRNWIAAHGGERLASQVTVWPLPVEAHPVLRRPAGERLLILGSLRSLGRAGGVRWFLREVWPALRAVRPDSRLDIVGADPPPDVRAADGCHGVRVHGFVEDLSDVLADTQACLIPLLAGGGIRVKIVELLARGIPCIGSPLAVQGMAHLPGIVAVDSARDWVDAVCRALNADGHLRAEALAGRSHLIAEHSIERAHAHLAWAVGARPAEELAVSR